MKPVVLVSSGDNDADFLFATGFPVEVSAYVRFAPGDDILIVPRMEIDRGREAGKASSILESSELGYQVGRDPYANWAHVIARALRDRGQDHAVVSAKLPVGYFQALETEGIRLEVEGKLFEDERRRKSPEEAQSIHAAQRAAEAACVEVIGILGTAEIRDGLLWNNGRPLTSEHLKAEAESTLSEIGYAAGDVIVAGSPNSAVPHDTGSGQIRAHAPVVIDIFPRGRTSHYYGDLTRTVVVGDIDDEVRRMHEAVVAALDAAIATIRPGVNGRDVHRAACRVLVEHGFGTVTEGFEGPGEGALMTHSLGHGVGLDVHEEPSLRDADDELREGDVTTVEPGLYRVGFGGVRVEDTGLVTQDGFRNFTSISRSLDPRAYL